MRQVWTPGPHDPGALARRSPCAGPASPPPSAATGSARSAARTASVRAAPDGAPLRPSSTSPVRRRTCGSSGSSPTRRSPAPREHHHLDAQSHHRRPAHHDRQSSTTAVAQSIRRATPVRERGTPARDPGAPPNDARPRRSPPGPVRALARPAVGVAAGLSRHPHGHRTIRSLASPAAAARPRRGPQHGQRHPSRQAGSDRSRKVPRVAAHRTRHDHQRIAPSPPRCLPQRGQQHSSHRVQLPAMAHPRRYRTSVPGSGLVPRPPRRWPPTRTGSI